MLRADQPNIRAMSAVTAGRAAARDIFSPPECDAPVSAIASLHMDSRFINKHVRSLRYGWADADRTKKQRRPQIFGTAGEFAPFQVHHKDSVRGWCGCRSFARHDADKSPTAALILEQYETIDQCEQGVVFPAPHVIARLVLGAPLARQERPGMH